MKKVKYRINLIKKLINFLFYFILVNLLKNKEKIFFEYRLKFYIFMFSIIIFFLFEIHYLFKKKSIFYSVLADPFA